MIRPRLFLLMVAILIGLVVAVNIYAAAGDPFIGATPQQQVVLDNSWDLAGGKLRHAAQTPRYDIGVFGNSRALDVNAADLDLGPHCRFFNFALAGESLRGSAALLERLAADGKAPRLAVVSIDNFELQTYANPMFLPAWPRWRQALADLVSDAEITWRERATMAWRVLYTENELAKRPFNIELLHANLEILLGIVPATATTNVAGRGYRADGSRTQPEPPREPPSELPWPQSRQVLGGYLAYDLARLAQLRARGTDVVVYESSIDPRSAARAPSALARDGRAQFAAACRAVGLDCHAASARLPGDDGFWRDSNHAPAGPLNRYVRGLIADKTGFCRP